jgi:hypothetical protein
LGERQTEAETSRHNLCNVLDIVTSAYLEALCSIHRVLSSFAAATVVAVFLLLVERYEACCAKKRDGKETFLVYTEGKVRGSGILSEHSIEGVWGSMPVPVAGRLQYSLYFSDLSDFCNLARTHHILSWQHSIVDSVMIPDG